MKTKYKILIAKIIYKILKLFFINDRRKVSRNGINWLLELNEGIDLSIFLFGNFEKSILRNAKKLLKNNELDIIDIGSNMGVHTLNFAKHFQNSKVYSLEPTDFAFEKLLKNVSLNPNLKNISAHQVYINDNKKRPTQIYSSWNLKSDNEKHNKHLGIKKSINKAQSLTLDEFIYQNKIQKKTLIKCDVDGNELYTFKSGQSYLAKFKPIIIMELAPYLYKENGYSSEELIIFIKSLNYRFYDFKTFDEITNIIDYTNSIKDGSSKNIILK